MGIWDYISSTTDAVKRNTPDPTWVKDLCRTSYVHGNTFGANAVKMAKNLWPGEAFRTNDAVEKIKGLLPDAEARSRINQFSAVFAKNAALYGVEETLKTIPCMPQFSVELSPSYPVKNFIYVIANHFSYGKLRFTPSQLFTIS